MEQVEDEAQEGSQLGSPMITMKEGCCLSHCIRHARWPWEEVDQDGAASGGGVKLYGGAHWCGQGMVLSKTDTCNTE